MKLVIKVPAQEFVEDLDEQDVEEYNQLDPQEAQNFLEYLASDCYPPNVRYEVSAE